MERAVRAGKMGEWSPHIVNARTGESKTEGSVLETCCLQSSPVASNSLDFGFVCVSENHLLSPEMRSSRMGMRALCEGGSMCCGVCNHSLVCFPRKKMNKLVD